ncbi:hypothetical protein EDF46_1987 [Frondihabitans sp. PhB188]|uniref:BPSS1187 family protein n=1 Tax=Frondihabitans sp. PhB188 TaxID=2485200 RepID=UPI000FA66DAB|nr:hypothetical protein [Frondihabitans sp. PhB188]ROQ38353.1 hypothetical protein EDF46_1987 [Frondihabitans sp. PhB188]
MKSGRVTRGLALLAVLGVAVLVLVSVETGSDTRQTAGHAPGLPAGLAIAGPATPDFPMPGSGGRKAGDVTAAGPEGEPTASTTAPPAASRDRQSDRSQVATGGGSSSIAAGDAGPAGDALTVNPYSFRLGLITGTVVEPDARNWAARSVADGPLLLFLPATGHIPNDYRRFLTTAAEAGYHVLGLDYFNRGKSVATTCGVDARCYTMVQQNRFNGSAPNHFSKIGAANSVLARLRASLAYLQKADPNGGWGQYSDDGLIKWKSIVVAGHSQGGGESAYIAHRHDVKGQLTFASPIITDADAKASWLDTRSATPASRMYGFDSWGDTFYGRILNSWQELGLAGPVVRSRVPVPAASDTGVHRLVTTLYLGDGRLSHLRTITDSTPLDADGTPVFEPVWKWMLARLYVDPQSPAAVEEKAEKADSLAK